MPLPARCQESGEKASDCAKRGEGHVLNNNLHLQAIQRIGVRRRLFSRSVLYRFKSCLPDFQ
jgi:hypothetical protein